MVEKIEIKEPNNFDEKINDIVKNYSGKNIYILIYGDWCPDCKNADPIINHYIEKKTNSVLVKASVGERPEYVNSPYKHHSRIRLRKIPTLIKWSANQVNDKHLVENECEDEKLLTEFFSD
ncbi:thioredoxin domain-containing protein 17-like protein [Gigaspora margarita]|uniref:Thioredoxin domain-containing protein 17-like protein n=1 Tax=Gigaspora margarita TaxID=4874 RepID=A0A8H3XGJ7_GIGMA|nr:thioredoxin domain-containing protein 17-like protein [Gigaspora margarita]